MEYPVAKIQSIDTCI